MLASLHTFYASDIEASRRRVRNKSKGDAVERVERFLKRAQR